MIAGTALGVVQLSGCSQSGDSKVTLQLPSALVTDFTLERIVLDVTGPDMPPMQDTILAADIVDPVVFNLDVPLGLNRTFLVRAVRGLDPLFTGFVGSNTVDVGLLGVQVPINMEFVNFAQDATGTDVIIADPNNPDINEVEILLGTGNDLGINICNTIDSVFFVISLEDFDIATRGGGLQAIIEFDIDNNPLTGSAASLISLSAGAVNVSLLSGTERSATLIFDAQGLATQLLLEDVTGPQPVLLEADFNEDFNSLFDPASSTATFCISQVKFFGQDPNAPAVDIDALDSSGIFNVLVGAIDAAAGFVANDVAFTTGNIHYELNFDTTGL